VVKFQHLFSPIKIGSLVLRNRIMSAPTSMADLMPPEGYPTRENVAYYKMRAQGGAAVVTLGDVIVQGSTGKSHPTQILMDDPHLLPYIVKLADAIKQHGAVASIELDHGGRECRRPYISGYPLGPVAEANYFGREIKEISVEQIESIAEAFGTSAATAKLAGFDMCTVHAGHGWLLSQFLSPTSNKRTDKFGGSAENRARFPLMCIESIRRHCGRDFPIEVRISGSEFMEGGYGIEEGIKIAKAFDGKVDLIHVSCGTTESLIGVVRVQPSMFLEHGCNVFLAAEIKKHVKTPVATVGGISDPGFMEEILASGKADIVALARALIADPYLPQKAKTGREEDIRPCLRCNVCEGGVIVKHVLRCSVNPVSGREYEHEFARPPTVPKKVMIAGGGPAGMQAAITAAERGHKVTLYEKTNSLGGALKFAEFVSFKEDLHKFRQYLERQVRKAGVEVVLNTAVTPELVSNAAPDVLIAAIGAESVIPPIPGINGVNVIFAADIHNPGIKIGKTVVIIGGGLVGCETGLHLAQIGKDVTIIEMLPELAVDANMLHRMALLEELKKYTKNITGTKCIGITLEGATGVGPDGKEQLFATDTVVIAVGLKPLSDTVEKLRNTVSEFMSLGDCVKPQKVGEAVRAGYYAAIDI